MSDQESKDACVLPKVGPNKNTLCPAGQELAMWSMTLFFKHRNECKKCARVLRAVSDASRTPNRVK